MDYALLMLAWALTVQAGKWESQRKPARQINILLLLIVLPLVIVSTILFLIRIL